MTRAIGYIRVSTDQQADSGISLAAQRQKLEAYAIALDIELVKIIEDAGQSAKSLDRPGLQQALRMLQAGEADGLLVAKLDRLTRSVADLSALLDAERFGEAWQLMSVSDSIDTRSPSGRLVLRILASVSEWEREAIGARTAEALAELKRTGVRLGGLPVGLRRGERNEDGRCVIEEDPELARTAKDIRALRECGLTMRAIAFELNKRGRKTARGGSWHASTVRNVLTRAA